MSALAASSMIKWSRYLPCKPKVRDQIQALSEFQEHLAVCSQGPITRVHICVEKKASERKKLVPTLVCAVGSGKNGGLNLRSQQFYIEYGTTFTFLTSKLINNKIVLKVTLKCIFFNLGKQKLRAHMLGTH